MASVATLALTILHPLPIVVCTLARVIPNPTLLSMKISEVQITNPQQAFQFLAEAKKDLTDCRQQQLETCIRVEEALSAMKKADLAVFKAELAVGKLKHILATFGIYLPLLESRKRVDNAHGLNVNVEGSLYTVEHPTFGVMGIQLD